MRSASATLTFAERDAILARARLVVGAISRRASSREWYRLRGAPGVTRLQCSTGNSGPLTPPATSKRRGRIRGFSDKSRKRLRVRSNEILWPRRRLIFVTLTYPGDFPHDPRSWKRDLGVWRRAFTRQFGPPLAIWALEFQRRGAPHFHLAIVLPESFNPSRRELKTITAGDACLRRDPTLKEFRSWSAETWYRIAGSGDERHLIQHRKEGHCKAARGPRGLVGYLQQELGKKTNQKRLPDWLSPKSPREIAIREHASCVRWATRRMSFIEAIETGELDHAGIDHLPENMDPTDPRVEQTEPSGAGRWWGIWGKLRRGILDERITPREFVALRRLMREQLRRRGAPHRWQWRWGHVMLFDRARRQWSLFHELMHYLAIVRGRPRPRGSFSAMETRASTQLEISWRRAA